MGTLGLAWRNVGRNRRRTALTLAGTALGVALALVAVGLTDGWYRELVRAATEQDLGHVQLHAEGYLPDRPVRVALRDPHVLEAAAALAGGRAAPRVYGAALAGSAARSTPVLLLGIDPALEARVTSLGARVEVGRALSADAADAAGEAVLGVRLARRLGLGPGDPLMTIADDGDGNFERRDLRVVGTVATGDDARDRLLVLVHVATARELLDLAGATHEVALLGDDAGGVEVLESALRARLGPAVDVKTWKELRPVVWGTVRLADGAIWIVLGVIFGLAGLGVANVVAMGVLERTQELGLLLALGMRPSRVVALVVLETAVITASAAVLGGALGLLLVAHLSSAGLDLRAFGPGVAQGGVTVGPIIHAHLAPARLVVTFFALALVALLASIGPALRAARLEPAEAARGG